MPFSSTTTGIACFMAFCDNRPPRMAFPDLHTEPSVSEVVNADAWLSWIGGELLLSLVNLGVCESRFTHQLHLQQIAGTNGVLMRECI